MCKSCGCGRPNDTHGGKKPSKPTKRTSRKRAAIAIALAAMVAPVAAAGIANAQDEQPAVETTVVSIGRHKYQLPADEVFVLCVDAREDSLDAAQLEVRPFLNVRGTFLPMDSYPALAAGTLRDAQKGDCFLPNGESITR